MSDKAEKSIPPPPDPEISDNAVELWEPLAWLAFIVIAWCVASYWR